MSSRFPAEIHPPSVFGRVQRGHPSLAGVSGGEGIHQDFPTRAESGRRVGKVKRNPPQRFGGVNGALKVDSATATLRTEFRVKHGMAYGSGGQGVRLQENYSWRPKYHIASTIIARPKREIITISSTIDKGCPIRVTARGAAAAGEAPEAPASINCLIASTP